MKSARPGTCKSVFTVLPVLGALAGATAAQGMFPAPSIAATDPAAVSASALDGVEPTYEPDQKITWYSPKVEPWRMFNLWIYPSIAAADDGARKLVVIIIVKDPSRGRPTSLQVDTGGEEVLIIPVSDSEKIKTHNSGCRVTQTIFLQNQVPLVRKLATATQARISLVGYQQTVHWTLAAEDFANFRRIAALWDAPALPPMLSKPVERSVPAGTVAAGESGVTNPVPIPSSKVRPRFPGFAKGKRAYGRVMLQAVVHKDGTVGEIEVKQGAGGDCGFEESAIEAVSKWRYEPATQNGQPIDVYFTIVVDFVYR